MGLNANNVPRTGKITPAIEAGAYPARLVQVIDLGLQPQRPFEGKEKEPAFMMATTYEMSDEFMKDEDGQDMKDKPRFVSEDFPLFSLDQEKAKSTKRYLSLDPNRVHGGDWVKLLGTPATVALVVNKSAKGNEYNNVVGVGAMRPKDVEKLPALVNEPKFFDLDDPDIAVFMSLPKFIQERIKTNLNFKASKLEALLEEAGKDNKVPNSPAKDTSESIDDSNPY